MTTTFNRLAIDLGTANTLIYCVTAASCWTSPRLVSIRHRCVGQRKKTAGGGRGSQSRMLGRTPGYLQAIRR